jgi:hypothetical protein
MVSEAGAAKAVSAPQARHNAGSKQERIDMDISLTSQIMSKGEEGRWITEAATEPEYAATSCAED